MPQCQLAIFRVRLQQDCLRESPDIRWRRLVPVLTTAFEDASPMQFHLPKTTRLLHSPLLFPSRVAYPEIWGAEQSSTGEQHLSSQLRACLCRSLKACCSRALQHALDLWRWDGCFWEFKFSSVANKGDWRVCLDFQHAYATLPFALFTGRFLLFKEC